MQIETEIKKSKMTNFVICQQIYINFIHAFSAGRGARIYDAML